MEQKMWLLLFVLLRDWASSIVWNSGYGFKGVHKQEFIKFVFPSFSLFYCYFLYVHSPILFGQFESLCSANVNRHIVRWRCGLHHNQYWRLIPNGQQPASVAIGVICSFCPEVWARVFRQLLKDWTTNWLATLQHVCFSLSIYFFRHICFAPPFSRLFNTSVFLPFVPGLLCTYYTMSR